MDQIVTLWMGGQEIHLFSAFSERPFLPSPLHSHSYPEIHAVRSGGGHYTVEGQTYTLTEGEVLLIPAGMQHETAPVGESFILAFRADLPITELQRLSLPARLLSESAAARTPEEMAPMLYYLLALLSPFPTLSVRRNDDAASLIHDYIEENYHRPLRLSELASLLHLSERQTQREIRRLTGLGFSELLRAHRMAVARRLAETTEMTAAEIAEYVGYETYSGFRRSFLKASEHGEQST